MVKIAIAGNVIDLGVKKSFEIVKDVKKLFKTAYFKAFEACNDVYIYIANYLIEYINVQSKGFWQKHLTENK